MMQFIFLAISALFVAVIIYNTIRKKKPLPQPAVNSEIKILQEHVLFYQKLREDEKNEFEQRMHSFLQKVKITGIETSIDDTDRVFVGAAAIIPIFAFKDWEYHNIHEVLIYPGSFDEKFHSEGKQRDVLGLVGNGAMQNMMILSQQNLRNDFLNTHSKSNTAIHEFVHLVDKDDGYADGCPEALLPHKYALPWLKRMHEEIQMIQKGKSDVNPYGATNEAEFLAVAAEYFFEQPELMQKKHPELFNLLTTIFLPKKSIV
jgi:Mlc titration factor MtfA (ptsG expression regulator)